MKQVCFWALVSMLLTCVSCRPPQSPRLKVVIAAVMICRKCDNVIRGVKLFCPSVGLSQGLSQEWASAIGAVLLLVLIIEFWLE